MFPPLVYSPLPSGDMPIDNISSLIENLICVRFVERSSNLHHVLSVLKARDSDFDPMIRRFTITPSGIRIGEPLSGAEDVMTGFAHQRAASHGNTDPDAKRHPRED